MRAKDIANHQVLIWAARNIGVKRRDIQMRLNRIDTLLSGSLNETSKPGKAVLDRLVAAGALVIGSEGLQKGPGYDAAMAGCAPERGLISAADLTPCVGKFGVRVPRREMLGQSPWMRAALGELLCRQAEGRLEQIGIEPGRVRFADSWNRFVETGELPAEIPWILREHIEAEMQSAAAGRLQNDELEILAEHLNAEIAKGFSEQTSPGAGAMARALDHSTGEELTPCLIGWRMVLHTARAEDDYDLKPLDLSVRPPDVVHMEISTGGDLCIVSSRDLREPLAQAINAAHIDSMNLPDNFNADAGALEFARQTQAQTGVMAIHQGGFFPLPIRERKSDRIILANYGNTISPEDARELEEEGDADYLSGYFTIEDPSLEFLEGSGIDDMIIAPRDALKRLFLEHSDLDESGVEAALSREEEGDFRHVFRFAEVPETLHLYIPHGRAIERFAKAFDDSGLRGALRGGHPGLLLSPDPVCFNPEYLVETVALEVPDHDPDILEP